MLQSDLRLMAIGKLGGVCCRCGFSDIRALQIDHKAGGGCKERRITSWSKLYRAILHGVAGYQLLCANCNWIKRVEMGEATGRPKGIYVPKPLGLLAAPWKL